MEIPKEQDVIDEETETITDKAILVVEDDSFLQDMICQKLIQQGFSVSAANNVESAKNQIEEKKFDLILLDLVLPETGGADFLKEMKSESSKHKDIPIMVLSNLYQDDKIKEAKEFGAVDFMIKSNHSPSEIVKRVIEIFAGEKKD